MALLFSFRVGELWKKDRLHTKLHWLIGQRHFACALECEVVACKSHGLAECCCAECCRSVKFLFPETGDSERRLLRSPDIPLQIETISASASVMGKLSSRVLVREERLLCKPLEDTVVTSLREEQLVLLLSLECICFTDTLENLVMVCCSGFRFPQCFSQGSKQSDITRYLGNIYECCSYLSSTVMLPRLLYNNYIPPCMGCGLGHLCPATPNTNV